MVVGGWFVGSAEFAGFHQPKKQQRGPEAGEDDGHEHRGNHAQRQQIQEKAGTEAGYDGLRRFTPRKIIGALHDALDRGKRSFGFFRHGKQRIAARRAAACIECVPAQCIRIAQPFFHEKIQNRLAIHTTGRRPFRELGSMKHFSIGSHWDAIKGQLKERYSQLTDHDLAYVEGKGEELLAHLRGKLHMSAKHLDEVLAELHDEAGGKLEQLKTKVGEIAHDAREKAGELTDAFKVKAAALGEEVKAQAAAAYDNVRQRTRTLLEEGGEYVRQNPRHSLLAALCAGFVAGLLIRR